MHEYLRWRYVAAIWVIFWFQDCLKKICPAVAISSHVCVDMVDLVVPHVLRKVEELRALWSLLVRLIDIVVLSTSELFCLHECIVQE